MSSKLLLSLALGAFALLPATRAAADDATVSAAKLELVQFDVSIGEYRGDTRDLRGNFMHEAAKCTAVVEKLKSLGVAPTDVIYGRKEFMFKRAGEKCQEYGRLKQILEATKTLEGFGSTLAINQGMDPTQAGDGRIDASIEASAECSAAVDAAIAAGTPSDVKLKVQANAGPTYDVTLPEAKKEICEPLATWAAGYGATKKKLVAAEEERLRKKYGKFGMKGDRLGLFMRYDNTRWRVKGCGEQGDMKKLAKAPLLFLLGELSVGGDAAGYVLTRYKFKGDKLVDTTEKTYSTLNGAMGGCKCIMPTKLALPVGGAALTLLAACTMTTGGGSAYPRPGGGVGASGTGPQAGAAPPPSGCRAPAELSREAQPSYLSSPADPWLGVNGSKPAALPLSNPSAKFANVIPREEERRCDASDDHCLRECTWLVTFTNSTLADEPHRVEAAHYRPDGVFVTPFTGGEYGDGFIAYRTVPATKRLVRPGVELAVRDWNDEAITSEREAFTGWMVGTLESVEWDKQQVRLVGQREPFRLSTARVVALTYSYGGAVEVAKGLSKDEIAVRTDELILPRAAAMVSNDPWSQVSSDGQPIAVNDTRPFDNVPTTCKTAQDHCLRPWVWFAVDGVYVTPARFDGTGFKSVRNGGPLNGVAYRTVPATVENLKVGGNAFVLQTPAGDEKTANSDQWNALTIVSINAAHGTFVGKGNFEREMPIEDARVPVLVWLPGDRAEKL